MDGDLSSSFDKIDEREIGFIISSSKHMLMDGHTNEDDKGKIRANLPLKHNPAFAKPLRK